MCGRFTLSVESFALKERFGIPFDNIEWTPRYNIAPSQPCLTIIGEHDRLRFCSMTWGLIPHWSKVKPNYQMINNRIETVQAKPGFRKLLETKRCLIPADGFYEWKKIGAAKVPFRFTLKDGGLFAFAGLWDVWQREGGEDAIKTFTILTMDANSLVSPYHERMPLILKKENEPRWLDPDQRDPEKLKPCMIPYPANDMAVYQAPRKVNSWKNDDPQCIQSSG